MRFLAYAMCPRYERLEESAQEDSRERQSGGISRWRNRVQSFDLTTSAARKQAILPKDITSEMSHTYEIM